MPGRTISRVQGKKVVVGPRELYIGGRSEQGWVTRLPRYILIPEPLMFLSPDISPLFAQWERLRLPEPQARAGGGMERGV